MSAIWNPVANTGATSLILEYMAVRHINKSSSVIEDATIIFQYAVSLLQDPRISSEKILELMRCINDILSP